MHTEVEIKQILQCLRDESPKYPGNIYDQAADLITDLTGITTDMDHNLCSHS